MTAAEVQSLTIAQLDEAIFKAASDLSFLRKIRKARQELEETLAGRTNLEILAGKPATASESSTVTLMGPPGSVTKPSDPVVAMPFVQSAPVAAPPSRKPQESR